MLTLDYQRFCAPAATFLHQTDTFFTVGQDGLLSVLLLLDGRCIAQAGGSPAVRADAGALLLAPDAVQVTPLGTVHLAGLSLAGTVPDAMAAGLEQLLVLPGANCPGGAELILALAEDDRRSAPGPGAASALAYTLLCRLAEAGQAITGEATLSPLVAAAIAQIREHYAEVYGVEELAMGLEVSKSHLIRSFTAAMGISPGRYLSLMRVESAKRLLLRGNYPLEVVASLCGFSGANYLCKVFKKETGETPAAWRRKARPKAAPAADETGWEDQEMYL